MDLLEAWISDVLRGVRDHPDQLPRQCTRLTLKRFQDARGAEAEVHSITLAAGKTYTSRHLAQVFQEKRREDANGARRQHVLFACYSSDAPCRIFSFRVGKQIGCEVEKAIPGARCGKASIKVFRQLNGRIVMLCPDHWNESKDPEYPYRRYYSSASRTHGSLPDWAGQFIHAVADAEQSIGTCKERGDDVLAALLPRLNALQYKVEASRRDNDQNTHVRGPSKRTVRLDAFHKMDRVMVEFEGGASVVVSAIHRDILRAAMDPGAQYLALGVPRVYTKDGGVRQPVKEERPFRDAEALLDDIYRVECRLKLPLEGVLLVGY